MVVVGSRFNNGLEPWSRDGKQGRILDQQPVNSELRREQQTYFSLAVVDVVRYRVPRPQCPVPPTARTLLALFGLSEHRSGSPGSKPPNRFAGA